MDIDGIREGFIASGIPEDIAVEIVSAYVEAKRRFYLGDHRPQAVEGGRFSEAVFRVLQHRAGTPVTPLGKALPSVDRMLSTFEAAAGQSDSVRLHIPRTLKLIYDIRNKRDVAHLGDSIDPNLQDASLVIANMDWVLAEMVRLDHSVSADQAQATIQNLVRREVPAIEEIDGHPVILADLAPRDQALVLLYRAGASGSSLAELADQLRLARKDNLRSRLLKLDEHKLIFLHPRTGAFHITARGIADVEKRHLAEPRS